MQIDFHYYAAYCAAVLAGFSHEESLEICTADQYTDCCTKTALKKLDGPVSAATTQTQMELMDEKEGILGQQNITRIWSSFHFLPKDLKAVPGRRSKLYLNKYRLICGQNGELLAKTVNLAKKNGTLQSAGIAMHILSDTWAHSNFAGTPSAVINNVGDDFFEWRADGEKEIKTKVTFRHKVSGPDDLDNGLYTSSLQQYNEQSVMNLGHGRVGHLPDYSFMKYRYIPSWSGYEPILKDNPSDYIHAFAQMIYALKYLRGEISEFKTDTYDWDTLAPVRDEVEAILSKRQLDSCPDWKSLGERLSGNVIPEFSAEEFEQEYLDADNESRDTTKPGKFIIAALSQKSMVTKEIYDSGNLIAGYSVDYESSGLKGIKDFYKLVGETARRSRK